MSKKNRRKMRKALATMLAALLLVVVSVGATVAYLTSQDTVTNTFTVGKVEIELDETDVDINGEKESDTRVKANEYKLMPGHTYIKDPTVTVKANSEEAYVRALVTVADFADLAAAVKMADTETEKYTYTVDDTEYPALHMLVSGWYNEEWQYKSVKTVDGKAVYEFWYVETETDTVAASTTNTVLPDLFDTITLPNEVDATKLATLEEVEVTVVAHAIQADGFDTAEEAWAAWGNN